MSCSKLRLVEKVAGPSGEQLHRFARSNETGLDLTGGSAANLRIMLQVKLAVNFCRLPLIPTPYLDGALRKQSMKV